MNHAWVCSDLPWLTQEIEATLSRSAQSAEGLLEAARILSSLKAARHTGQTTPSDGPLHHTHPTTAAFADNIAQQAENKVQESSSRQQRVQEDSDRQQKMRSASNKQHQEVQQQMQAGSDKQQMHYQDTAGSNRRGSDRSNAGTALLLCHTTEHMSCHGLVNYELCTVPANVDD